MVDSSPLGPFILRIGAPSPAADRLCEQLGHRSWVYITACNPRSRVLTPQQNAARMAQLEQLLRAQGWQFFPGAGRGEDPSWAPEPSLFVPGIDRELALQLGRHFHQHAVVYGEQGGTAELLITSS